MDWKEWLKKQLSPIDKYETEQEENDIRRAENKTCKSCRYWSELVAQTTSEPPREIEALCLVHDGPRHGTFTRPRWTCQRWHPGKAIDWDEAHTPWYAKLKRKG